MPKVARTRQNCHECPRWACEFKTCNGLARVLRSPPPAINMALCNKDPWKKEKRQRPMSILGRFGHKLVFA